MHWVNRILLAGLLAAAAAFWPRRFDLATPSTDLARVKSEHAALLDANANLREQIRLLRAEVSALGSDPAEVARIGRQDLNLVMPGEVVFEVVSPGGSAAP